MSHSRLTRRCSGLASLAAELHIVRPWPGASVAASTLKPPPSTTSRQRPSWVYPPGSGSASTTHLRPIPPPQGPVISPGRRQHRRPHCHPKGRSTREHPFASHRTSITPSDMSRSCLLSIPGGGLHSRPRHPELLPSTLPHIASTSGRRSTSAGPCPQAHRPSCSHPCRLPRPITWGPSKTTPSGRASHHPTTASHPSAMA